MYIYNNIYLFIIYINNYYYKYMSKLYKNVCNQILYEENNVSQRAKSHLLRT